jgi:hypothetical protein
MEPIAVTVRGEGRWVLIHRCLACGRLRLNRSAADDNVLLLMRLAALPLAHPPVPQVAGPHDWAAADPDPVGTNGGRRRT